MTRSPKPKREANGKSTSEWVGRGDCGRHFARVTVAGGRERYALEDRDGCIFGHKNKDRALARKLAAKISARARSDDEQARRRQRPAQMPTVEELGKRWTDGELLEEYGDVHRLDENKSADSTAWRLAAHVYPVNRKLARRPGRTRRHQACDGATSSQGSVEAVSVAGLLARPAAVLARCEAVPAALRQTRSRSTSAARHEGRPEALRLPVPRRTRNAACVRGGAAGAPRLLCAGRVHRAAEVVARRAHGGNVDAKHGRSRSPRPRNDMPQMFEVAPALLRLLERWRAYSSDRDDDEAILTAEDVGHFVCERQGRRYQAIGGRAADALRHDLRLAGVDRAQLFGGNPKIEPIRFHDLRATFVTWAVRQGRG